MTTSEERRLRLRIEQLEEQLRAAGVDVPAASGPASSPASRHPGPIDAAGSGKRPLRALVLDLLDDLGTSAYSREISQILEATTARKVPPTRFGALSADEERAFLSSRPRPVYLAHCLTYERAEPIKRLWARSDWPLSERLVGPTTGRVRHLRTTVRLCEMAAAAQARGQDATMLSILAADHASDVPGVRVKRGTFELDQWRAGALAALTELEPRDRQARAEAAAALSWMPEHHLLFGPPQLVALNDDPTPRVLRGPA